MSNMITIKNYKKRFGMSFSDIKLYVINSIALAISITNVEVALKLILLSVSILYTIMKIIDLKTNKTKKNEEL